MPTKKQTKKINKRIQPKQTYANSLRTWLIGKPVMFSLLCFCTIFAVTFVYSVFAAIFDTSATWPLVILLILTIGWNAYYMIKKLPHTDMYRDDFVAITNGCSLITILVPLLTMCFVGFDVHVVQYRFMWLYAYHPIILWIIGIFAILVYLYTLGIMVSNIYAKYKRAVQIGISKRLVIASMPFAFLLMWTPGYLIADKTRNSNLTIKSEWYAKFNKWVVKNATNTLFVFLMFVLFNNLFSGALSLLLTGALLVIYALWNLKYKTKFIKEINNNYALCAVGINVAILIIIILRAALH